MTNQKSFQTLDINLENRKSKERFLTNVLKLFFLDLSVNQMDVMAEIYVKQFMVSKDNDGALKETLNVVKKRTKDRSTHVNFGPSEVP